MKCSSIIICILFPILSVCGQVQYDTVNIYFDKNISTLRPESQEQLSLLAPKIKQKHLLIYGYADYLGTTINNLELARNRANNVKAALLNQGIEAKNILVCDGIGEISRALPENEIGVPKDRYVSIFIKKDKAEQNNSIANKITSKQNKGIQVSEIKADGSLVPIPQKENIKKLTSKTASQNKNSNLVISSTFNTTNRFEQLASLKKDEVMRIDQIQFQPTRHFLKKESEPILIELLQTLKDNPELAIKIEGHVCCMTGNGDAWDSDTHELKLSENRAKYIYDYLVQNGIAATRLQYEGFGKRRPIIAHEKTEEDAQKNRRVEIRVLQNPL